MARSEILTGFADNDLHDAWDDLFERSNGAPRREPLPVRTYTATILARQLVTVTTDDERQVERLAVEQVKAKLGEATVIVTSFEIEAGERKETCGRKL